MKTSKKDKRGLLGLGYGGLGYGGGLGHLGSGSLALSGGYGLESSSLGKLFELLYCTYIYILAFNVKNGCSFNNF